MGLTENVLVLKSALGILDGRESLSEHLHTFVNLSVGVSLFFVSDTQLSK